MMENIYHNDSDSVENNIRRSVREWEEAPPAGWDTPSPALWDKIAAATPPPPAATGLIWWKWLSGALLVLGVVAGSLWWTYKPSTPEKQTPTPVQTPLMAEQSEQPAADPQPESDQQALPETPAAAPVQANELPKRVSSAHISTRKTPASSIRNAASGEREGLSKTDNLIQNEEDANAGLPTQNEATRAELPVPASESSQFAALPETQDGAGTPLAEAPALVLWSPTAPLESAATELLALPAPSVALPASSVKRAPKRGHFYAGVMAAPNETFRRIQSDRPIAQLPAFLKENESATWATEYGVRVGWQPNRRFALSMGVGSYNMSMKTQHRFRVPFDPGRERPIGNNNFESSYNLSVPSSYGDANVEVAVQRPGNQPLIPGQFLTVDTRTQTELRYTNIPLTATYFLHSSPRLSIGIKGGVALSLLDKQDFSATSTISMRGLRTRNITVQRQAPDIQKTMVDYHLGAALWYRPAPGWALCIEPSYRQAAGAAIEYEAYSVSQYAWGVQLGVQKSF